jgi:hypothetical protein
MSSQARHAAIRIRLRQAAHARAQAPPRAPSNSRRGWCPREPGAAPPGQTPWQLAPQVHLPQRARDHVRPVVPGAQVRTAWCSRRKAQRRAPRWTVTGTSSAGQAADGRRQDLSQGAEAWKVTSGVAPSLGCSRRAAAAAGLRPPPGGSSTPAGSTPNRGAGSRGSRRCKKASSARGVGFQTGCVALGHQVVAIAVAEPALKVAAARCCRASSQ